MTKPPLFLGFETLGAPERFGDSDAQVSELSRQIARLLRRLDGDGIDATSVLSLELFVAATEDEIGDRSREILRELGTLLAPDVRPVVTIIPVSFLGPESTVSVQAVVMPGHPARSSLDGRFPTSAIARDLFVAASNPIGTGAAATEQQSEGMDFLRDEVRSLGAEVADIAHVNFYYLLEGNRDDWREQAAVRAASFTEPGPCATGIPITCTAQSGGTMQLSSYGSVGARSQGRITDAWPDSPWEWPFRLPYRHGNRMDQVVFVGGQSSTDADPELSPCENLASHTKVAFRKVVDVLEELKCTANSLVRLTVYYVVNSESGPQTIRAVLENELEGHVLELSLIGIDALAHSGMVVEIDGQAIMAT